MLTREAERFAERWIAEPNSGCWLWIGHTAKGYGQMRWRGKVRYAHRIAWELATGTMPTSDVMVCHHCDTPTCVNPDHLFLGTNADNMRDAGAKGRLPLQIAA